MVNSKNALVGALGVLLGVVVGVSSSQLAQTVSFSGTNPNAADGVAHRSDEYKNSRRANYALPALPVKVDLADIVESRLRTRMHGSADEFTPYEQVIRDAYPECNDFALWSSRHSNCVGDINAQRMAN